MINTEIRQFRDSLVGLTNACLLPIEIKRLVFSELLTQINNESEKAILAEKTQQKKETNENDGGVA